MELKVRFRFNTVTGEVEEFEVADEGPMRLSEAEHNREHDRIAAEVGNVIERNPRVDEVLPGTAPRTQPALSDPPASEETTETPEQQRRRQAE